MQTIKISTHPEFKEQAAKWFSKNWDIPYQAYLESMQVAIDHLNAVPEWYVMIDKNRNIVDGAGIIENDFHERTDLTPNLCALFVEEKYRNQHLAKQLLNFVKVDCATRGFEKLYLITDMTNFYEKCGWQFLIMVKTDEGELMKMYESEIYI
ncbi:GNAT family N-acetyltransferase [Acinetobacter soli]|uniref:GNAT family N-acetyltransferase n=1 Tax=Acinetobacter soli TaxID=487316 RepID=UPI00124FEB71|nr:GNAT family N-acetyltransferase [Acinetobacter soli]